MNVVGRWGSALLTVGAVLGASCLVLVVLAPTMGVRPLLFRSDSMSPTIEAGDLAIARSVPVSDVEVDDIVSVTTSGGDRVTHRVAAVDERDGSTVLTLRGDANEDADPSPYEVARADRVSFVVPWAGHVLAAVTAPLGLFLLGVLAMALVTVLVRGGPRGGAGTGAERPGGRTMRRWRTTGRLSAATGSAMAVLVAGPASAAPWTDDVAVTGTTLSASTVPAPTLSCQNLGLLSLRFNWTAVAGATSYRFFYNSGANVLDTTNTTAVVGSLINGKAAWVTARRNFGSTIWVSANSNSAGYSVGLVATCA